MQHGLMSVGCVCLAVAWTVFYWYGPSQDNMVVGIVLFSCMLCANVSVISFRAVALPSLQLIIKNSCIWMPDHASVFVIYVEQAFLYIAYTNLFAGL